MNIIDLCAGPGGASLGLRAAMPDAKIVGIEFDEAACATARAAGHHRVLADMTALDPAAYAAADFLHASPPCQGFSFAGQGKGRQDGDRLLRAIKLAASHRDRVPEIMAQFASAAKDPRSVLTLEPLRWIAEIMPEYVTLEQVPTVLPIWNAYGDTLAAWGYTAWTGRMHAEQYGVAQTRTRAILMARKGEHTITPPPPTHSRYYSRDPERLDEGVLPWVSMDTALGGRLPADHWGARRPATTIVGSFRPEIVRGPGYRKAGDGPCQNAPGATEVSVAEAGMLQGFPHDYPWRGNKGQQHQQVGNAVPPPLMEAIVKELVK